LDVLDNLYMYATDVKTAIWAFHETLHDTLVTLLMTLLVTLLAARLLTLLVALPVTVLVTLLVALLLTLLVALPETVQLLSSFIGKNPMSDHTRTHVHSLKLNARDTQTVGPIL